ncbi:RNA-binding family protein [Perilla frutescens var. hirtella]|nr:RNA-binding family protein [Perilla frutescens var. hirtella]
MEFSFSDNSKWRKMVNSGEFRKTEFFKIFAKMSRRHLSSGDLRAAFTVPRTCRQLGLRLAYIEEVVRLHLLPPRVPSSANMGLKAKKKAGGGPARGIPKIENRENKATVLYIGRIAHGFYEIEMKAFFKQIGTVRRFEILKNRKAGKSKHFEFIEFQSPKVAKVGEECMHNYLMYQQPSLI